MNDTQLGAFFLCLICLVPFILGYLVCHFIERGTRRGWLPEWLRNILERIS